VTYTVYALRIKGDIEPRYIGQTAHDPETRLKSLRSEYMAGFDPTPLARWLHANRQDVEAVALASAASREDARSIERKAVHICLALGHRLFNRDHVPASLRIDRSTQSAA
jgi:hypothetical protein